MHWGPWGVWHLSLAKLFNCNQILGHVADQNYVAIIDQLKVCFKGLTKIISKLWQLTLKYETTCMSYLEQIGTKFQKLERKLRSDFLKGICAKQIFWCNFCTFRFDQDEGG